MPDNECPKRDLETKTITQSSTNPEGSSSHKHLEVAMVADDLVVKKHGEENLSMKLMILAHLVSADVAELKS